MAEKLSIKPYARLLTMLGEQLIKNERVALIEIAKNSYDADASWVKVSFKDFGPSYEITADSKIIIEDDGDGMNDDIIRNHWINPATPEKKKRKTKKPTTRLGRHLQGEKGIGRFAILKLGKTVNIYTTRKGEKDRHRISYDFSPFGEDFDSVPRDGEDVHSMFLDELTVNLSTKEAPNVRGKTITVGKRKLPKPANGTKIVISNLTGSWTEKKVNAALKDLSKLQSIFSEKKNKISKDDFYVAFHKDDEAVAFADQYLKEFHNLLDEQSVLRVRGGKYSERNKTFKFMLNDKPMVLKLADSRITGLRVYRQHFKDQLGLAERTTECGDFSFDFYVFDFSSKAPGKYKLDRNDKDILKDHRIYLYRDGIRVYPYGEPDDDWLRIDQYRGTIAAGDFLSNDQVVGVVGISHQENPLLQDKTNREGLIEKGNASDDFVALLQCLLGYLRTYPYKHYRQGLEDKKTHDEIRTKKIDDDFDALQEAIEKEKKSAALTQLKSLKKSYETERDFLVRRAESTEDLAGIGLSVETATHDVSSMLSKALTSIDGLVKDIGYGDYDPKLVENELHTLRGMLSFVSDQMSDIQLLFKSSKQRRKRIRVKTLLEKVLNIYKRIFKLRSINFDVEVKGSPLVVKSTEAVLLQLLINLFDNSVYWLEDVAKPDRAIKVVLDGDKQHMIVSDSGPGIHTEDIPYIFEPFYSGKGEEGRGLGLYIARQLLERHGFLIEYSEVSSRRALSGANFIIDFVERG
jgi:signal transduction histidine kinase